LGPWRKVDLATLSFTFAQKFTKFQLQKLLLPNSPSAGSGQPKNFGGAKNLGGAKIFDFR